MYADFRMGYPLRPCCDGGNEVFSSGGRTLGLYRDELVDRSGSGDCGDIADESGSSFARSLGDSGLSSSVSQCVAGRFGILKLKTSVDSRSTNPSSSGSDDYPHSEPKPSASDRCAEKAASFFRPDQVSACHRHMRDFDGSVRGFSEEAGDRGYGK